jgi:CubicO group peptidase (beta-lactamase class C family)
MKKYFFYQGAVFFLLAFFLSSCSSLQSLFGSRRTTAEKIDAIMQDFSAPDAPGASVLVMKMKHGVTGANDSVLFKKGYGLANLEEKIPVTTTTNFRLASMTKQFTAMCIMMLHDEGKLSYDDTLSKFFGGLPKWGNIVTVKNLLNHTSGIVDYESLIPDSQTVQVHDSDVLNLVKRVDTTYFAPGSKYQYSNSGYSLLALIVQKVSGQRFADFLKKHIFDVVGMPTSVAYENGISTVANRAYGYSFENGTWKFTDQSSTSAVLGDGGIYTNVEELAKWYSALFVHTLVSLETQQLAWTRAKVNDGSDIDYGFGWHFENYRGIEHPFHGGSTVGFRNNVQVFPAQHLVVIVLTNRNEGDPIVQAHEIAGLFLER